MLDLNRVLAFAVEPTTTPCEVRVNFGVFAGRKVTPPRSTTSRRPSCPSSRAW